MVVPGPVRRGEGMISQRGAPPESRSGGGLSHLFPMEKLSEDAGNR
jgi:hypothetical protein